MSKRCELQKEYYKEYGNYKGDGKYTDHYVAWLEERVVKESDDLPCVSVRPSGLDEYRDWKEENPDEGFQYDEIQEFTNSLSRGDLQEILEYADAR